MEFEDEGFCEGEDGEFDFGFGGGRGMGRRFSLGGVKTMKGPSKRVGLGGVRDILAEFPGDHPVLRALRAVSRLSHAAFTAVWMAVVLVESFLGLLARGGVFAVEVVCAMLDWVGADY